VGPSGVIFDHSSLSYSLAGDGVVGVSSLTKRGAGTLTLLNPNNYTLTTAVEGGLLVAGDGAAAGELGSGPVSIASGATLAIRRNGLLDYSAGDGVGGGSKLVDVSGAGSLVIEGGVDLVLNPAAGNDLDFSLPVSWADFSGDITVREESVLDTRRMGASGLGSGTLVLGDATTSGSLAQHAGNWVRTNDILLVGPANQIINRSTGSAPRWFKLQGQITGDGGLGFADAAGTFTSPDSGFILTGNSNPSGTLSIPAGVPVRVGGVPGQSVSIEVGDAGSLGSATVANEGTLTFSRTDAHTVDAAITGFGEVRIGIPSTAGLGDTSTQVVTFADTGKTYQGTTTVESGTLQVNGSLPNSFVDVNPEGILGGTGTIGQSTFVFGSVASGASVGTLTFTDAVFFEPNSSYQIEIADFTGSPGSGYDTLSADDIQFGGTASEPVTLVVQPLGVSNFSETATTFTVATTSFGFGALDPAGFVIDDSAFAAETGALGTWAVQLSGDSQSLELTYTPGVASGYTSWISGFFPESVDPAVIGFDADPDGDGIGNGVENFLGTAPDVPSAGLGITSSDGSTLTVSHSQSNDAATDVSATYEWSSDLVTWQASGEADGNGVTVTLQSTVTDDQAAPANDTVEVTATVTAGSGQSLFLRITATEGS
jgi:autotransporter-associated beta strand protein